MWLRGRRKEAAQDTGAAHPFLQPPLHRPPHGRSGAGRTVSLRAAELGEWAPTGVIYQVDNVYAKTLRLISFYFLEYEGKCEAGSGDEPRAFVENYCMMLIALFKNLGLRAGLGVTQQGTQEGSRDSLCVCVCV